MDTPENALCISVEPLCPSVKSLYNTANNISQDFTGLYKQYLYFMDKAALLEELENNSYVMLKPSSVEGVGVFAIRDIPVGCRMMFSKPGPAEEWLSLTKAEVAALPPHARFLVENYCLYDDAVYFVPAEGFKKMDLSLFINHSDQPNIISINDGEYFEATRDINAGEELFVNYGEIVED